MNASNPVPGAAGAAGGRPRRVHGVLRAIGAVALVVLAAAAYLGYRYRPIAPQISADPTEYFKYGSIGGDGDNGLPLEIMKVLPRAFPQYLPKGAPPDYTAFGFVQEPGHAMPIGFSTRQRIVPVTGFTCSACHVGTVRASVTDTPRVILGMGAKNLDIAAYFQFLFASAADPHFTGDYLIPLMRANGARLNAVDRLLYGRLIIPTMKQRLAAVSHNLAPLFQTEPPFGPGRADGFNAFKVMLLADHYPDGIPADERAGTSSYPAIWNQRVRIGMAMNWDGNSPRKRDRDIGAAFSAGATKNSIDVPAISRISDWLRDLPAPAYPWHIDSARVSRGAQVFAQRCASCHAVGGAMTGKVDPLVSLRTDPHRVHSYTAKLNSLVVNLGHGYSWQITDMHPTTGYANKPLDGVWAHAPYLHNGSVPTLYDLLTPEDRRNGRKPTFYVGHGVYDTVDVGIRTDIAEAGGRPSFLFDTRLPGNSNLGHSGPLYGTDISEADKRALIEYLKTLR